MSPKSKPKISIVVAVGNDFVIGFKNKIPWMIEEGKRMRADMMHFLEVTKGKPVIMGQRTFESIGKPIGRPEGGRKNIILTQDPSFKPEGSLLKGHIVMAAHSIPEALALAGDTPEVMIGGGLSIYTQFLPMASRLYLTLIDGNFEGDAYFPALNWSEWEEKEKIENDPDEENSYKYTFLILERK